MKQIDPRISRRAALTAAGASIVASTAPRAASAQPATTYIDGADVAYQSAPRTETCGTCLHWSDGARRVVINSQNPSGWCRAYVPQRRIYSGSKPDLVLRCCSRGFWLMRPYRYPRA